MLLSELLADVLGDEPTDQNIWLATRRGRSGKELALELLERYRSVELEPLPAKTPTTFRPGFLLDYYGRSETPYDREFTFVGRALSYADQVVVVDELAGWASQPDPEAHLADFDFGGFPECGNLVWALRRIGKYAALEDAQLLYYIDAPDQPDEEAIRAEIAVPAASELAPLVAERLGWVLGLGDSPFEQHTVAFELGLWFTQLYTIFDHTDRYEQNIDLYLPEWFAGPELLNWLYRHETPPEWMTSGTLHNQQAVVQLLDLPAPSADLLQQLSSDQLLAVREADHMSEWRTALRDGLGHLRSEPDLATRLEVHENLQRHADRLRNTARLTPVLREGLSDAVQAGLAVAPVAAVTHQAPLIAAIEATSPISAALIRSFFGWLLGGVPEDGTGDVRDLIAESASLRTFLNEPATAQLGAPRRPPTSWIRTMDGRPVALDLF